MRILFIILAILFAYIIFIQIYNYLYKRNNHLKLKTYYFKNDILQIVVKYHTCMDNITLKCNDSLFGHDFVFVKEAEKDIIVNFDCTMYNIDCYVNTFKSRIITFALINAENRIIARDSKLLYLQKGILKWKNV